MGVQQSQPATSDARPTRDDLLERLNEWSIWFAKKQGDERDLGIRMSNLLDQTQQYIEALTPSANPSPARGEVLEKIETILSQIAGKNDLSAAGDDPENVASEAFSALHACEILAREALEITAALSHGADTREAVDKLQAVFDAAHGLCMGYDWNCGTAAKLHGYRRKLLSAVHAIKEVPDFDSKYRDAGPRSSTATEEPRQ